MRDASPKLPAGTTLAPASKEAEGDARGPAQGGSPQGRLRAGRQGEAMARWGAVPHAGVSPSSTTVAAQMTRRDMGTAGVPAVGDQGTGSGGQRGSAKGFRQPRDSVPHSCPSAPLCHAVLCCAEGHSSAKTRWICPRDTLWSALCRAAWKELPGGVSCPSVPLLLPMPGSRGHSALRAQGAAGGGGAGTGTSTPALWWAQGTSTASAQTWHW